MKNKKFIIVGKVNKDKMPNGKKTKSFRTVSEAEQFIEKMMSYEKQSIENGDYFIDVPPNLKNHIY